MKNNLLAILEMKNKTTGLKNSIDRNSRLDLITETM